MNDALGQRMKEQYENRTRFYIPRRTYTIVRVDGKAFHTYTRHLNRPFDEKLVEDMVYAALNLSNEMQNCKVAYVQSDEASFLMTDFSEVTTEAWFNGNIQKIASVSAGLMTAYFMKKRGEDGDHRVACFDARVFTIPDRQEVINYFIWRQKDAIRNSLQMLAQSLYSHKELHKKSQADLQEMCFSAGHNWNDLPQHLKSGSIIYSNEGTKEIRGAFDFVKERERFDSLFPRGE